MARAARRGKATHTLVEQFLKGQPQTINDVLPNGMFRLLKPYLEQIDNIHCLEKIMFSHKLTLAGQVDCIAEYNGKLSVIDFKTANKERMIQMKRQSMPLCEMYEELFASYRPNSNFKAWKTAVVMLCQTEKRLFVSTRERY